MFISQAFKYKHDWWRYVIGAFVIFIASQIGTIPLIVAVMVKMMGTGQDFSALNESTIMTVLDSNLTLFLMLLSFAIGLVAVYFIIKFLHNQPFVALTTSRKKIDWKRFFFGFGLIFVTTLILISIDYYQNPENYILQFNLVPFLILVVIALIMIPLQTSFEEYLFRGYLMQGIGVVFGNKWIPLLVTSLIFGGLHFFNPEVTKIGNIIMIYYIGTGLFLGIITLMDEGMELSLGFHAGNNLITALLVTADWTVFQTNSVLKDISEPSAGFDVIAPVFIIYPIFLAVMAYRYKWKNWGEKLFGKVTPPVLVERDKTRFPGLEL